MHDYREALAAAVAAAREAGEVLREGFAHPGLARRFDLRAEEAIRRRLRAATPWGYSSDEAGYLPGVDPSHLWLVDPDDGTFHYNQGARGSAVGIAALRGGVPVLGVVFAFAFPDHDGDLIAHAEGCGPISRDGKPVEGAVLDVPLDDPAVRFDHRMIVFLSPDADRFPHVAAARCAPARHVVVPSIAYRLALVAVGEGVGTLSLNSPCAWDYASGHALLRAAGGIFVDQDGEAITYAADGTSTCTSCFAGGPAAVAALRKRLWTEPAAPVPHDPAPLLRASRYSPARREPGKVIVDAGLLSRAQGCLLGQLAGDALGGLVEFREPGEIRRDYPGGCRDLMDGGTWHNLAGQPTDDSELALLLSRTLARDGKSNPAAVLEAYLDWWNDPRTYDRGNTLRQALSAAALGSTHAGRMALLEEYASHKSQSNGSLMRVSPLGIFLAGRGRQAAELAREDSRLTHPNPACVESCACFVAAIATAIATGCGPEGAYLAAMEEAERAGAPDAVREALRAAREAPPADYVTQQGWVLIALQNAFYQLLHARTLEDGLVATVMAGGDTNTTAAIAGALLGAVHGREAIPARWRRCLQSCRRFEASPTRHPRAQEYWPVDALELAECLLLAGGQV
jgi:ADP-ribosylglycohydrolase/fructose-1,6-bisphosphatase/inositol monophosphatase family enzyme